MSNSTDLALAPVHEASLARFKENEYTARYLSLPSHHAVPIRSRTLKNSGEDGFFGETVQTPRTIPHAITLRRNEDLLPARLPQSPQEAGLTGAFPPPGKGAGLTRARELAEKMRDDELDIIALVELGSPGLDGHPRLLHGGMACMLMDEMMSVAIGLYIGSSRSPVWGEKSKEEHGRLYTAQLDVRYRAPVHTSAFIVLKAWT
ncbi:acid phosphatase pho5, partial [Ascosphaera pollenicola]